MRDFKLDIHPKINSGFETPEGYFDTFSERLMLFIPKPETKVISFYAQHKNWIYTVAASLIVIISIPVMNQLQKLEKTSYNNEIENYLIGSSTINDDEIVNLLYENNVSTLKINIPIDTKATEEILTQNPNIEEYITE